MSFGNTKTPRLSDINLKKARYQLPMKLNETGHRLAYYFTPELLEKFKQLYPRTPNKRMMELFGVSFSSLVRLRKIVGVEKDIKFIRRKVARETKKKLKANGYYDSLRGKAPSLAAREASRKRIAEGFHPLKILKEKHPRKYKKMIEERRQKRIELEAHERKRVNLGIHQLTRLHRPQFVYTRRETNYRYLMKQKGYILGSFYESDGERYTIYYDEETERNERYEAKAAKYHFTIKPLPEE